MKTQPSYRYSVLRYVHDIRTQEFLNVAVLFHSPDSGVLQFRSIEKAGRLSGAFPRIDSHGVIQTLKRMGNEFEKARPFAQQMALEAFRSSVLPKDDSSLRWAPAGGGVSDDLTDAFESVFYRYVGRYERKNVKRVRSDQDVWDVLRRELDRKHILANLQSAQITTPLKTYRFLHSWQNHSLHILKPFSLDGTDKDEIAEKAAYWAGVMHDIGRSKDQFQLHFVLGKPRQSDLQDAFSHAGDLLRECASGGKSVVHDEIDIPVLAARFARDVAA